MSSGSRCPEWTSLVGIVLGQGSEGRQNSSKQARTVLPEKSRLAPALNAGLPA